MRNDKKVMEMKVTEGISVNVMPNNDHEYLMTTREVANGYGTSEYAIRKSLLRNNSEFIENKHFVTAGTFCPREHQTALNLPHNATLWTKRGIVRLGFFIRSERSKLFRDWAEDLIIRIEEQKDLFGHVCPARSMPEKRNHNRLTQDRLVDILKDVAMIDDRELRIRLVEKLTIK